MTKLFHVITRNDRTGKDYRMTETPEDHETACVLLKRLNPLPHYPYIRRMLIEVEPNWIESLGRIELYIEPHNADLCSHPGDCAGDVLSLSKQPYIQAQVQLIDPALLVSVLKEYGAWDEDQLKDHAENIQRLLWLAANDISEDSQL